LKNDEQKREPWSEGMTALRKEIQQGFRRRDPSYHVLRPAELSSLSSGRQRSLGLAPKGPVRGNSHVGGLPRFKVSLYPDSINGNGGNILKGAFKSGM
jgi:hypothetical protein